VLSDDIGLIFPILIVKRVLIYSVVSMFTFGVISIEVWSTQFPVWAFVLALVVCASA
jgi:hypothetical protein